MHRLAVRSDVAIDFATRFRKLGLENRNLQKANELVGEFPRDFYCVCYRVERQKSVLLRASGKERRSYGYKIDVELIVAIQTSNSRSRKGSVIVWHKERDANVQSIIVIDEQVPEESGLSELRSSGSLVGNRKS